jgi:hypothetical protein
MTSPDVQVVKDAAGGEQPSVKNPFPVDSILAVSRFQDGTPAQSPGFKSVNPEFTAAVSEDQLRVSATSAVDHEIRSAQAAAADGGEPVLDPVNKALKDAHDRAGDVGAKIAQAEKVQGV